MRQAIYAAVLVVVMAIFLVILFSAKNLARWYIKRQLYRPVRRHLRLGHGEYRDLMIPVSQESINVWYLHKFAQAPIILYFHGNQYNISYRQYMIDICNILGLNILLVDYRGYGRSKGEASAPNVLEDAEASYQFLRREGWPSKEIIVWGESLGGSPACRLAKYPIKSLILFSAFASLHDLLNDPHNPLRGAILWPLRATTQDLNKDTNNVEMLKEAQCPILILHSPDDQLIPYEHASALASAAPHAVLVDIKGNHDSPRVDAHAFGKVLRFLELKRDKKKVEAVVKVIDNLSFVAQKSASVDTVDPSS